ncbi:MAG: 6-carboxytetrahydropterin synthase [Phycisphaerales bacterium]
MLILTRTVRFSPGQPDTDAPNGYAGSPRVRGLGRYFEVRVRCRGEVDPRTGYLVDIKRIDRAVAAAVVPEITRADEDADPRELVGVLARGLRAELGEMFDAVRWMLTPTYSLETEALRMETVLLRQKFDFAAAHRLHNPALSDEENVRLYGKCNNPRGHGHNYQFEPCVAVPAAAGGSLTLAVLERVAKEAVLDRFDHKHLNEDTEEFRQPGGLNPSVENIARVFFGLLYPRVAASGGELLNVTVWETDRTCATYPG